MIEKRNSFGCGGLERPAAGETEENNEKSAADAKELEHELRCIKEELVQVRKQSGSARANREYKDSVFTSLFSERKYAFMLYQDLHPEDLTATEEDVKIITLENIFTKELYNDAGMRIGSRLIVLTEHQSTYSFNIPTRLLLYIAEEYKRELDQVMHSLYQKDAVLIPAPEFYMVYTGKWQKGFKKELFLSDLFEQPSNALELRVPVIYEPAEGSILGEYTGMVRKIESLVADGVQKIDAIEMVVSEYRNDKYRISDFLNRRKDVTLMFNHDITLEEIIEVRERESWREGEREGERRGERRGSIKAYHECGLSIKQIAEKLSVSEEDVESVLKLEAANV